MHLGINSCIHKKFVTTLLAFFGKKNDTCPPLGCDQYDPTTDRKIQNSRQRENVYNLVSHFLKETYIFLNVLSCR